MLHHGSSCHSTRGSAIALALITCAILAALGATSYMVLQNRFRLAHQAARWQEAMLPAEAGIDMAINEVRKQLYMADLSKDFFPRSFDVDGDGTPDGSWQHGEPYVDQNENGTFDSGEGYRDLNENGVRDSKGYSSTVSLSSDPNHRISFSVLAEPLDPVSMGLLSSATPYWRIRSIGKVTLPSAAAKVTGETAEGKASEMLRKLEFFMDRRTQEAITTPQATRVVEAILKPLSTFRLALFGTSTIDMTNHNIVVDSYDSRYANKSTYDPLLPHIPGQYNPLERQQNGDIATNGKVINAGGAHIYGDAATNGGTAGERGILNGQNVTGEISNDFFQEVFPVSTPKTADGKNDIPPDPSTPSVVDGITSIVATDTRVAQFRFDSINLSGQSKLTIKGKVDPVTGKPIPTYAQIVVTGNIDVSGQGQIILEPGVYVRIFLMGNADITGNGFANPNTPLNLQLYGIDKYKRNSAGEIIRDTAGNPVIEYGKMKISGNGGFMGAVYAPHYDLEIKGGGNADTVFGSFVARNIFMNGVTSVHYDEALGDGGLVGEYKVVSWFEDVR